MVIKGNFMKTCFSAAAIVAASMVGAEGLMMRAGKGGYNARNMFAKELARYKQQKRREQNIQHLRQDLWRHRIQKAAQRSVDRQGEAYLEQFRRQQQPKKLHSKINNRRPRPAMNASRRRLDTDDNLSEYRPRTQNSWNWPTWEDFTNNLTQFVGYFFST